MSDEMINRRVFYACLIVTIVMLALAMRARGDDRHEREHPHHEVLHNYIIERQEHYQIEGVPTSRMIIGRREIDIYSNGQMFEGNHLVGQRDKDDE